jgi:hypothetical protein
MNVKKLPITVPAIIGLHYHAYSLAAAFCYEKYLPWFYSHYIQVYCTDDFSKVNGSPWFNFVSIDLWDNGIPFLSNNHLLDQKTVISNKIDVVNLIRSYIDRGWYTYAEIDDFYIPFRSAYQKRRQAHDIFIFGYDLKNNCFDVVGFNNKNVFAFEKLNFGDFEKAYYNSNLTMLDVDNGGGSFIRFFKVLEELECKFDLILVTELLSDYINSVDTTEKLRMYKTPIKKRVYGMDTYNFFKEYYRSLLDKKIGYDIRPIHLLWEHKKCMLLRIEYMYKNNFISQLNTIYDDYKHIVRKTLVARNLMLKYNLANDKESIIRIINILDDIENRERVLLTSLLDEISP